MTALPITAATSREYWVWSMRPRDRPNNAEMLPKVRPVDINSVVYMASWWGMMVGSLLFLPALLFTGLPSRATWVMLLISAAVEAAYFIILPYAYEDADFSLVYPLARGAAPALIAVWSVLLLGEQLTPGGIAGLVLLPRAPMCSGLELVVVPVVVSIADPCSAPSMYR